MLSRVQLFTTPWTIQGHGILQARILEWVAFCFSRGSFYPSVDILGGLPPCLGYCDQCCCEHRRACTFLNYVFLWISAQEQDNRACGGSSLSFLRSLLSILHSHFNTGYPLQPVRTAIIKKSINNKYCPTPTVTLLELVFPVYGHPVLSSL